MEKAAIKTEYSFQQETAFENNEELLRLYHIFGKRWNPDASEIRTEIRYVRSLHTWGWKFISTGNVKNVDVVQNREGKERPTCNTTKLTHCFHTKLRMPYPIDSYLCLKTSGAPDHCTVTTHTANHRSSYYLTTQHTTEPTTNYWPQNSTW